MLVDFKKISVKGFLSIAEAELDLSGQGMVYVTGKNNSPGNQDSNGAGKSTLFEAIMYALTGTTLRGTKDVVNIYWKGGYAEVTLELSVDGIEYKIMRTRSHPDYGNNLKIWRDGEDISGDKLKKSEVILGTELGQLTSSLISSVIILGQGLPNKFTDLSPIARKDRLEELSQSSEFVGELKARLANFKKLYETKSNRNDVERGKVETLISTSQAMVTESVHKLEALSQNSDDEIALTEALKSETESIEAIRQQMGAFSTARFNTNEIYTSVMSDKQIRESQKRSESSEISKIVVELNNLSEATCPTCHQKIKSEEELAELRRQRESRVVELKSSIHFLDSEISELEEKRKALEGQLKGIDSKYNDLQSELNVHNGNVANIQARISKLRDTSEELNEAINRYSGQVAEQRAQLDVLSKEKGVFDLKLGILDWLADKSSKEFRSFMLTGVVEYINTKLAYYSERLFGTPRLELVLKGNKIFITYDNRAYENLSGGERQRADLAMQFSLRDMLINSLGFNCNLLIIDEGFDNLDSSGVTALVSVINEMSAIDSVFTISHHTLSIPFDKTIEVVKGMDKISTVHETI